jgi:hypothetical protein
MKRSAWAAAAVGLAIVIVIATLGRGAGPATSTPTTATRTYSVSNPVPLAFGANDQSIAYGIPHYKDMAVQQADLTMLEATGAGCIRADIGYGPWLTGDSATQALVSATVASIKGAGKCLIIADASSETYRNGGCLNWAQFKAAWVQRVSTLAALYHPDYYIVIKEPGWYPPMVCDAAKNPDFQSVSGWLGLTQNLTSTVLAASPSTAVGVAVGGGSFNGKDAPFYVQYLNQVQRLQGLSFIADDPYSSMDQAVFENYLSANPPSKALWIAEAWSTPTPGTSADSESDAAWMKSIALYARQIGASMLIPFYTDLFSGYNPPTGSNSLVAFYQDRTPVYTEFRNAVSGTP